SRIRAHRTPRAPPSGRTALPSGPAPGPARVAAGRRAAYVTDGGDLFGSVHFAAGIALRRAAGCVVTGIGGRTAAAGGPGLVAAADAATRDRPTGLIRELPKAAHAALTAR
ncbi:hypothetical protein ABZ714_29055, partial [Streptomyces sp. NPDC006798]